jgi:hypothetical protein
VGETGRECSTHGEKRKAYRILVGELEGKRPLEIPRRTWVDNVKMVLRKIGWGILTELIWLWSENGGRLL